MQRGGRYLKAPATRVSPYSAPFAPCSSSRLGQAAAARSSTSMSEKLPYKVGELEEAAASACPATAQGWKRAAAAGPAGAHRPPRIAVSARFSAREAFWGLEFSCLGEARVQGGPGLQLPACPASSRVAACS